MRDAKNYYQAAKIKQTAKNRKIFFLAVAPTYGSYDQKFLAATQRSLGFYIYKIKNTNVRRTLKNSIFGKYTNLVYGTLVLVSPQKDCNKNHFAELLSNKNKKRGLVVMCAFLNKKIYPISYLNRVTKPDYYATASNLVINNFNPIKKSFSKLTCLDAKAQKFN